MLVGELPVEVKPLDIGPVHIRSIRPSGTALRISGRIHSVKRHAGIVDILMTVGIVNSILSSKFQSVNNFHFCGEVCRSHHRTLPVSIGLALRNLVFGKLLHCPSACRRVIYLIVQSKRTVIHIRLQDRQGLQIAPV